MRVRTPKDVGNLVRERRQDLRLTQQQLADRARVGRPWLVAVESGHARAEMGKVLDLLAELELSVDISVAGASQSTDVQVLASAAGRVDLDELLLRHDQTRP